MTAVDRRQAPRRRGRRPSPQVAAAPPAAAGAPAAVAAIVAALREQSRVVQGAMTSAGRMLAAAGHDITWSEAPDGMHAACGGCRHTFLVGLDDRGQFALYTTTRVRGGGDGLPGCRGSR